MYILYYRKYLIRDQILHSIFPMFILNYYWECMNPTGSQLNLVRQWENCLALAGDFIVLFFFIAESYNFSSLQSYMTWSGTKVYNCSRSSEVWRFNDTWEILTIARLRFTAYVNVMRRIFLPVLRDALPSIDGHAQTSNLGTVGESNRPLPRRVYCSKLSVNQRLGTNNALLSGILFITTDTRKIDIAGLTFVFFILNRKHVKSQIALLRSSSSRLFFISFANAS